MKIKQDFKYLILLRLILKNDDIFMLLKNKMILGTISWLKNLKL